MARCHEAVIVFAKIGEAISEVIGPTSTSFYHGKMYIGAPNLDTVAKFGLAWARPPAGKDRGFASRKWSSGPQTRVFLDVGPGRRRCGLGQSAICRKNASFCHGKVDIGPGRRRCGLGHSAICRESTSFYHGKVDIGAPILDAVKLDAVKLAR